MIDATTLLTAERLGRRAAGKWLVRDASLSIRAADRIVLQGPSGSGKSVLLRLLAVLDPPDEGRLLWRGAEIPDSEAPPLRRQVAYCAQQPVFLPGTVEDNLRVGFSLRHASGQYDQDRVAQLLEAAQWPLELLSTRAEHLSGGERLTVSLLRAMLLSPQILLLDEPTAALDEQATPRTERLVDFWMSESPQRAFLWITHDSRQSARLAGRQLTMDAGALTQAGGGH